MEDLEDSTFEKDLSPVARLLAAHDLPSPSEVFIQTLSSEVNREDVSNMKEAQGHMLQRFEKTNEMLLNFNTLSSARYEATAKEFKHHTQLMADMKKDLNNIFRRIRSLKTQLSKQFPESFSATKGRKTPTVPEEDEEPAEESGDSDGTTPTRQTSRGPEGGPQPPGTRPGQAKDRERAARAQERLSSMIAVSDIPHIVEPSDSASGT